VFRRFCAKMATKQSIRAYFTVLLSANLFDVPYVRRICCSYHFLEFRVWIFHALKILTNEKRDRLKFVSFDWPRFTLFTLQFSKESVQTPPCKRLPKLLQYDDEFTLQ
jgi:hypothetical protein